MTNILELLKNEKVEWKKLGEVCEFINGFAFKSSLFSQSGEAVIRITNINSGKVTFDDLKYIKLDDYPELDRYKVEKNNILVAMSGATTGKIGYQYEDRIGYLNQRVGKFIPDESKVKRRFLFHFLYNIESELFSLATGSGAQPNLSSEAIKKIDIPIPSLEIQERIVKILDKFTNYVTELQSELQSRTKQYTYYRDKLLSEEYLAKVTKEMEEDRRLNIVQLEEVVTIKNGKDWKKLGQGNIPVYGSGGEIGVFVDKYSYDKPTVLIPRKGSIDNVFYLDKPFWNVDTIFHTEIDGSKLIPKYFYYFIEHYDLNKLSDNSTRPSLTQSTLNKLKIPLPPLSLQNKIVKVLDKFQILLSDTKGLIPEEIEQRQKQYEYYREKLLTFDVECDSTHARTHARTHAHTAVVTNNYYDILQEVSNIVEVDIEDKIELKKLLNITKKVDNINWKVMDKELRYIDLSSVNTGNKRIEATELITKTNAPSRAKQIVKSKDIIFGTTRPMQERLALIPDYLDNQVCSTGYCVLRSDKEIVKEKWLYYNLLKTDFYKYVELNQKGASYPAISDSEIKNYKIPIPPLHVQQHVVSILDKFDTLVNDIKEGLPKEIEQRQQQYEYWRECLLNFPR